MLEVLKFIFKCVIEFISMLFTIDLGFTNLGALMCIVYIFLPVVLFIINFIKGQVLDELDDRYDESRPRNIISSTLNERTNLGDGKTHIYTNTVRYNRRFRKR